MILETKASETVVLKLALVSVEALFIEPLSGHAHSPVLSRQVAVGVLRAVGTPGALLAKQLALASATVTLPVQALAVLVAALAWQERATALEHVGVNTVTVEVFGSGV